MSKTISIDSDTFLKSLYHLGNRWVVEFEEKYKDHPFFDMYKEEIKRHQNSLDEFYVYCKKLFDGDEDRIISGQERFKLYLKEKESKNDSI